MTATTQAAGDATTKVATDAFVTTAISNAIAGVNPAVAVVVATTQASDTSGLTYNNGVAGIGATLTGSNNTPLTFDGVTLTSLTQRVLVKNDTQSPSGAFNGVYYLTQLQTAILPPILTRALDFDMPSDINSTGAIPVTSGTVNTATTWVVTSTVATVGTDPITFAQFSINPANVVDLTSTQTLTNKTLTTPGITSYTFATLPAASSVSGKVARVTDVGPATAGSLWISDGTLWRPANGAVSVFQTAIPFVLQSSGSIGNNGALTGLTSLGVTLANCYMWFPTNTISAATPAGWYFVQMSSGTAGTIFNNTYTSGVPVVPASPTAFATTGPGAYTQTTGSAINALQYTLKGNVMGVAGMLRAVPAFEFNSSAGTKTWNVALAGQSLISRGRAAATNDIPLIELMNTGVANKQIYPMAAAGTYFLNNGGVVRFTIDTTADQTLLTSLQLGTATDYLICDSFYATVIWT